LNDEDETTKICNILDAEYDVFLTAFLGHETMIRLNNLDHEKS